MAALDSLLHEAIRKLEQVEDKTNKYLDSNMAQLYNKYVIPEMRAVALAMNLPSEFADSIEFRKTGKNHGQIVNTWGTPQKPLAAWFNYGTARHWIQGNPLLSWISKGASAGRNASAIFYQNIRNQAGMRMFSKGHYVSGLNRTEAMETGMILGEKRLRENLPREAEGELTN